MFTEDNDHWDIAFGVIVVGIIITGLIVAANKRESKTAESLPPMAVTSAEPPTNNDLITAPARPSSSHIIATVYECVIDGQRVMSDHPCSPDARVREIQAPNRMDPQDTSRLYDRPPSSAGYAYSSPRSRDTGSSVPVSGRSCDAIQAAIDTINARMRQKYTSREGEQYRERLRQLREARWEANCHGRRR